METLVITLAAFLVAALTLFSGFGLGTVLMPVFALFFPVPVAIAATAIVHLANNLFKLVLIGRSADRDTVLRFAVPAALAAVLGAGVLVLFSGLPALLEYRLAGRLHAVTPLKAVIGVLILGFAALEMHPGFSRVSVPPRFMVLGGLLSGFFGGLSGNQGALRSAFLIKAGLDRDAFVGTCVVSAVIVDLVRLTVYGLSWTMTAPVMFDRQVATPLATAILAAFLGSWLAARWLRKVTLGFVRGVVAVSLAAIGLGLAAGIL